MNKFCLAICLLIGFSSCSHSKPKATPEDHGRAEALAQVIPADPDPEADPNYKPEMTMDAYLNDVVLPKITKSAAVHECFINNPKAKKRDLAKQSLSFQFEIKLEPENGKVIISHVYLSMIQNLPLWARTCVIENYEKLKFPPFPDATLKSTRAFGNVTVAWKNKPKN